MHAQSSAATAAECHFSVHCSVYTCRHGAGGLFFFNNYGELP